MSISHICPNIKQRRPQSGDDGNLSDTNECNAQSANWKKPKAVSDKHSLCLLFKLSTRQSDASNQSVKKTIRVKQSVNHKDNWETSVKQFKAGVETLIFGKRQSRGPQSNIGRWHKCRYKDWAWLTSLRNMNRGSTILLASHHTCPGEWSTPTSSVRRVMHASLPANQGQPAMELQ